MKARQAPAARCLGLLAGVLLGVNTLGQEHDDPGGQDHCRLDEVDMGDYCASLRPARTEEEKSLRRITPFRSRGMMPGRVSPTPPREPQPGPAEPVAAPAQSGPIDDRSAPAPAGSMTATPTRGFAVQLGVYSDRAVATGVARPLAEAGLGMGLAPLPRDGRTLWACLHGPFPDEATARLAAERLRIDHRVRDTYIKPLHNLEWTELSHDSIEE